MEKENLEMHFWKGESYEKQIINNLISFLKEGVKQIEIDYYNINPEGLDLTCITLNSGEHISLSINEYERIYNK